MSLKSDILRELAQGPQTAKQLRGKLKTDGKKIVKTLKMLEGDGEVKGEKGLFALAAASAGLLRGRLTKLGHSFGFVAPLDEENGEDIFVPGHSLCGAMPGDEVTVSLRAQPRVPGSREGEIIDVVWPHDAVTGIVTEGDGRLALLPDNAPHTPLLVKRSADGGAKPGEKVAGQILERGERHADIRVGIVQRFGAADSARHSVKAILYANGVEKAFPAEAKVQAKAATAQKLTKDALKGRLDLREEPVFTIDAASTKDIDDAIHLCKTQHGYRLGVHIADVSYYVPGGTPLDEEALRRGTSIYYADSVIPMLPKALSNGICSLNPDEDRLAFSCIMELDNDSRMLDYQFKKSVIRSRVKGVYEEINAIFADEAEKEVRARYKAVARQLPVMLELYQKLASLRAARGDIDIESDEAKLVLDEEGCCVDIQKRTRGNAEKMIEEFMLAANNAAAHLARRRGWPFVYRVHEKPGAQRAEQLATVLEALGVANHFKGDIPTQAELAALLDKTRGTNLEVPVHRAILRTMAKARYAAQPLGHYGLALGDYAHFTSPIRRYPDLAIHRILSDACAGVDDAALEKKYRVFAEAAAKQSSARELVAMAVERGCDDCYKAEYMHRFIGQEFDGVITSAVAYGLYVGLPNTVEGLVHASVLSQNRLELVDGIALREEKSGLQYRIGDALRVRVAGVDVSQGKVDFVPAVQE